MKKQIGNALESGGWGREGGTFVERINYIFTGKNNKRKEKKDKRRENVNCIENTSSGIKLDKLEGC